MPTVTLITKQGCHLCEDAHAAILAAQRRVPFDLVVRDLASDAELERLYALEVPVVLVDGVKRFFGRVSEAMLVREVTAARLARGR